MIAVETVPQHLSLDVEQKEVGKERQRPASGPAQRLILAVQFTVSEKVCKGCGHPLFGHVREVDSYPSPGAANLGSPGTAEQRRGRDRMRDGRSRTMR